MEYSFSKLQLWEAVATRPVTLHSQTVRNNEKDEFYLNRQKRRVTMAVVEISQFMTPTCDTYSTRCVTCCRKFTRTCKPRLSRFVPPNQNLILGRALCVARNVWPSSVTTAICSRKNIPEVQRSLKLTFGCHCNPAGHPAVESGSRSLLFDSGSISLFPPPLAPSTTRLRSSASYVSRVLDLP